MANVSTKEFSPDKIRNIALVGHGGAGKTTFTESFLYTSGAINRMGKVEEGSSASDYHADEIERRISINSALVHCEWNGVKLNILDTPGYSDFVGEVISCLRVADTALVLVKAVEGVEVGTEQVWNHVKAAGLPAILVVNKLNNENADFDKAVASAVSRFGHDVVVVQFPVNQGLNYSRCVDVLKMKLVEYTRDGSGKTTVSDIPADLMDKANQLHEALIEKIAESDEALMNTFFEQGTLPEEDMIKGLRASLASRKIFPLLCQASDLNVGTAGVLDFVASYAPSPKDRGSVHAVDAQGKDVQVACDPAGQPAVFVFKTISEAHVGELSFYRVYSGTVNAGLDLLNTTNSKVERLGQIFMMNGKDRQEVAKLQAGDIGTVVKLKDTHTNNTLASKASGYKFDEIKFPDPAIRMAILSKTKGDEEKIASGLHSLHEEDPTLTVVVDGLLSQTLIGGQGELHLLISTNRLKAKYGVETELIEPKVPYKETIKAVANDVEYKHKKQTGGRGQYGHVHIKIEPRPRGTGFEFEDAVVGGVVPGRFIPAVEKGVIEVMQRGALAGYEVVDVKVTLFDGTYHSVDSDEHSFKIAGRMAFKKGFALAKPVILEPINDLEVVVPEEYMGDVMGDISGRRGKIMGMEADGPFQIIKAQVPAAEIHRYSTILRSMTQGRGVYKAKFSHYEEAPREVMDKLIAAASGTAEEEE